MDHPGRTGIDGAVALGTPDQLRERLREAGRLTAQREVVRSALAQHRNDEGPLLPILHTVQEALGFIPAAVVPDIAEGLNLSRAEVHGVITYYHHFRSEPAGRHVLQICRAEACQAMGADALWAHACARLGLDAAGTDAAGDVTLEPVYCLGLCAMSPAGMLDERPHGRLTPQRLDAALAQAIAASQPTGAIA